MHPVLRIPEVLLNIFSRLTPSSLSVEDRKSVNSDLAALARTCCAFKEPALDILWSELYDPSPLPRCLPNVCKRKPPLRLISRKTALWPSKIRMDSPRKYLFTRPLERAEWDILRSYTRRVWCIRDFDTEFNWNLVIPPMNFTPADPLFPNLRSLHCDFTENVIPLLHLSFPSLIRLDIHFPSDDLSMFRDPLQSLIKKSPNIKRLEIICEEEPECGEIVSNAICSWSNLQALTCPQIFLDVDALAHLSRMPMLTWLKFLLSPGFPGQMFPSLSASFSNLNHLELHAESLAPISTLLSWTRLPAIIDLIVVTDSCPFKQDFTSCMANIQMANMGQTIQELNFSQASYDRSFENREDAPLLDLDDLRPCMSFHNLRRLQLVLVWGTDLSDGGLLTLASAWPRLEELLIDVNWRWNRPCGITPDGLADLLQTCPSLTSIALAIDTRGYTQFSTPFQRPFSPSSFECPFHINVLDSVIMKESMAAMAAFFTAIVPHFDFILTTNERSMLQEKYRERWEDVGIQAKKLITKRWLKVLRELSSQPQVQLHPIHLESGFADPGVMVGINGS